jgi:glycosyltransferase involved in cell wall biosynthesis
VTAFLSGYATSFQALERDYPLVECVRALRAFCDEVVVADGGSTDGTWRVLEQLAASDPAIRPYRDPVDRTRPRWALALDGGLKARARARCRGAWCWQADLDELPADGAGPRLRALAAGLDPAVLVVGVPFVEYWGALERVRADIRPVFPRLSRNEPWLTHGVPLPHRRFDRDGELHAAPYRSDSCDYVDARSWEAVPVTPLFPAALENWRRAAQPDAPGDDVDRALARSRYQFGFNELLEKVPAVFHVSWLNVERKLRHYREHWPRFHASLFDEPEDAARSPIGGKPWRELSDAELERAAARLRADGPRVLHGEQPPGPVIRVGQPPPAILEPWLLRNLEPEPVHFAC